MSNPEPGAAVEAASLARTRSENQLTSVLPLPRAPRVRALAGLRARLLPLGPGDLALQLAIWFGFLFAYQLVRGLDGHDRVAALANGLRILELERRLTHRVIELSLQHLAESSHWLLTATAWTYWNSEFTVVGLALLWIYLRRHPHFTQLRNSVLLANLLGLIGYALAPTAPPRMFPQLGFSDTLDTIGGLNHGSGLVQLAGNPYAAMPSLHAADALIVAVMLYRSSRRTWVKTFWLLWPGWVWFSVIATANHYLLDVIAGIAVAATALGTVTASQQLRHARRQTTTRTNI